ncbi:hypothetical protein LR48_Vigan07g198800 [Vigna angularis]|uniref:Uncharacterized protein n=1 Tax=Phaseolus angularis TaxID=3914 RepID=A0A0L9V0J8_PHAAN|nr:hypothetical protein LR48_Vigan07g198800 [Vigna angularis]
MPNLTCDLTHQQKSRPGALSVAPGREPLGKSRAWAPHFSRPGASFSQKVAPERPFFTPGRDQHTKLAPGHFSVQKLALCRTLASLSSETSSSNSRVYSATAPPPPSVRAWPPGHGTRAAKSSFHMVLSSHLAQRLADGGFQTCKLLRKMLSWTRKLKAKLASLSQQLKRRIHKHTKRNRKRKQQNNQKPKNKQKILCLNQCCWGRAPTEQEAPGVNRARCYLSRAPAEQRSRIVIVVMVNLSIKCLNVLVSPYSMYFRAIDKVGATVQAKNGALNMVLKTSKKSIEYGGSMLYKSRAGKLLLKFLELMEVSLWLDVKGFEISIIILELAEVNLSLHAKGFELDIVMSTLLVVLLY